jgi:hypothetical protein
MSSCTPRLSQREEVFYPVQSTEYSVVAEMIQNRLLRLLLLIASIANNRLKAINISTSQSKPTSTPNAYPAECVQITQKPKERSLLILPQLPNQPLNSSRYPDDLLLHHLLYSPNTNPLSFSLAQAVGLSTIPPHHIPNQPLQTLRGVLPVHEHLNHTQALP